MNRLDTLVALAGQARAYTPKPTARTSGAWFRIANAAADSTSILLYDVIGDYGVTASDFVNELAGVSTNSIDLHINSGGGSVFDGVAIHAALVNHPATVNTIVDGIAASAASFIAMAGDTRSIEKPASMMIHDASGLVLGNAADMRSMADLLDQMSDVIAGIYADRSGGTVPSWRTSMQAETWFTSSQAVAAGLADTVLNDNAAPENRRSQLIRARARVTLKG
jgi:ATP-dependent protease ClpP protease subunit